MDWLTDSAWPFLAALIPSIGLGFLFYVLMKHILEADRRERAAQREWEASLGEDGLRDDGDNGQKESAK